MTVKLPRRLGLLGDIHAEDRHLAAALGVFRAEGVDAILAVGDIVDGRGDVDRCVALLQEHRVLSVRGNHERWLLKNEMRILPEAHSLKRVSAATAGFLEALPAVLSLETAAGELLLCHGVGDDDMVRLGPDDEGYALACIDELQRILGAPAIRFVVAGHTHRRMVRAFARSGGAPLAFVNAGTLRHGYDPCFAILDVHHGVEFFDLPTTSHRPDASAAMRKLWPFAH